MAISGFNTQFAEEAFTVYDHPKVLIFKKDDSFSTQKIEQSFSKIDLTKVINLTPTEANLTPGTLTIAGRNERETIFGGTWAQLFNPDSIVNSNSIFGLIIWYFNDHASGLDQLSIGEIGLAWFEMIKVFQFSNSLAYYCWRCRSGWQVHWDWNVSKTLISIRLFDINWY